MFRHTMGVGAAFYVSSMFPKTLSQGSNGAAHIQQAARAGEGIHDEVRRAIEEFLQMVSFLFGLKAFLSMFDKMACFAFWFMALVHADQRYEAGHSG